MGDPAVLEWLSRRNNRWNRGSDLAPVVLRAAADFILEREAVDEGASIVGDKSPSSMLNGEGVENLYKIYPDCRLLVIIRDPSATERDIRIVNEIAGTEPKQLGYLKA